MDHRNERTDWHVLDPSRLAGAVVFKITSAVINDASDGALRDLCEQCMHVFFKEVERGVHSERFKISREMIRSWLTFWKGVGGAFVSEIGFDHDGKVVKISVTAPVDDRFVFIKMAHNGTWCQFRWISKPENRHCNSISNAGLYITKWNPSFKTLCERCCEGSSLFGSTNAWRLCIES